MLPQPWKVHESQIKNFAAFVIGQVDDFRRCHDKTLSSIMRE